MSFTNITDPVYLDAGHRSIRFMANIDGFTGPVHYVAVDGDPTSQSIFDEIVAGAHGAVTPYSPPPGITVAQAQQIAEVAVSTYADAIVSQVTPSATRQAAFQSAAAILAGNGGALPTSGPYVGAFNDLASAYGVNSDAFAALVVLAQTSSMQIETQVRSCLNSIRGATDTDQIATAITNFMAGLSSIVSRLNAVLPTALTLPTPISIKGVNV